MRASSAILLLVMATAVVAQEPPPPEPPGHGISDVDPAPLGGAINTPLPEQESRRLRKYDIPELTGAHQAIGSQLIDGRLPRPQIDYSVHSGKIMQRLSIFEGGLVVLNMKGAGGVIRKKLLLPPDAVKEYLRPGQARELRNIRQNELPMTLPDRWGYVRVYEFTGASHEWKFDPAAALPKALNDVTMPLSDLLRAMSEDRTVTSTVANYEPKVGDELIGDDRKTYRVERLTQEGIVELHCVGQPTIIYVDKKDLYNYFIGARGGQ